MSGRATCACTQPLPVTRAERKGAASTECARCELPIAPRLGQPQPLVPPLPLEAS